MFAFLLCIVSLIAFANISEGYRLSIQKWNYRSAALFSESPKESIKDIENKQVTKGLTHIKYNKYAPSAEEAAGMTDEEFRGTIMRRMVSHSISSHA